MVGGSAFCAAWLKCELEILPLKFGTFILDSVLVSNEKEKCLINQTSVHHSKAEPSTLIVAYGP